MKSPMDFDFLEESTETLRALAHPIRLAVIMLLKTKGPMTVTEIFESLDIQQAVASHHLRIMRSRNIVKVQRDGQNSIYSLVHPDFYNIVETMETVLK
ncbi:MAG: winged helix-turn-helix transcriptional regulator [Saprospiraceae bacterium]|nr:winged helix-turn-helix transcriptional regulator [Saprospiraceae bacterium]